MEIKHRRLSQKMRRKVYEKMDGHCAYCGCDPQYEDTQVNHVKSLYGEDDVF